MIVGAIDTSQMEDAIDALHTISLNDPASVEQFLLMDEELSDVIPCGAGMIVVPSHALQTFISWNRNKLQ